jgi:2-C-methyl-D-erythritol 4-phosphate cytidylyltransferase / 2-C-methyl-D-erythritol 2,4-cyclodiphosphate synthase
MSDKFADAVVVAAGASRRMGGVDKLDAQLGGKPLLAWSIGAMRAARSVRRVIVVTNSERMVSLAREAWFPDTGATLVAGGVERSDSVRAGVSAADAEVVLVHDGARPLVSPGLVDAVAAAAAQHGAAIPVVPVADSLKVAADGHVGAAVDRDGLAAAQTPQGARRELLVDAFDAAGGQSFTDEAGLLQAIGIEVHSVPGEVSNIKVTRADDLDLVRAIVAGRSAATTRTGYGQDGHQFGRQDGLWLGGLLIAEAPRLHGHSDGDAVLHALTTALLSAIGAGDLGRLYPPGDAKTAGIGSAEMLARAVGLLAADGWRPASVGVALVGARPRLGAARLDQMRARIAELLAIDLGLVSVTASTGNLSGAEGSGRAISATALVSVVAA